MEAGGVGCLVRCGEAMYSRSCAVLAVVLLVVRAAIGAGAEEKDKPGAEKPKIPPPENLVIQTPDGIPLAVTFYPGTKGKDTIPVVLLHMAKGNRNDYAQLATDLQKVGHAVLVPDLRGHGESAARRGAAEPLQLGR